MNYTREELFKHSGELLELIEDIVEYYFFRDNGVIKTQKIEEVIKKNVP